MLRNCGNPRRGRDGLTGIAESDRCRLGRLGSEAFSPGLTTSCGTYSIRQAALAHAFCTKLHGRTVSKHSIGGARTHALTHRHQAMPGPPTHNGRICFSPATQCAWFIIAAALLGQMCCQPRASSDTTYHIRHLYRLAEISPQSRSPSSNFSLFAFLAILHRIEVTAILNQRAHTRHVTVFLGRSGPTPTRGFGWLPWIGSGPATERLAAGRTLGQTGPYLTISTAWPAFCCSGRCVFVLSAWSPG